MNTIEISGSTCVHCGNCVAVCPLLCLMETSPDHAPCVREGAEEYCIACGHCMATCPVSAVSVNGVSGDQCEPAVKFSEEATFEPFASLVYGRRSIRRYEEKHVPREKIEQLLEVTRWAPTARNVQPVRWLVVNNAEKVHELAKLVVDYLQDANLFPGIVDAWNVGVDMIHRSAPCLVIAHAHKEGWRGTVDCTIAVQTLDYAAAALGMGTCWAGFFMNAAANYPPIAEALKLPSGHAIEGALMLGYSDEQYRCIPPRNPIHADWID